jgi:enoyl-CoA hydratase/carnithine racemase
MKERVRIEIEAGVAHVHLARGDSMNALDEAMFDALVQAGQQLKDTREVRCVVLSGEGRAFCAGLDKSLVMKLSGEDGALTLGPRTHGIANREQYAALVWREIPVPVIAAVHGVAFGGGLQLMLGADVRLVAPDARLSIMEVKWGLVPDMAGTVLMRSLVRDDVARELTYTGRIISGEEAVTLGLATRACSDPIAAALAMAREISSKSPSAIRAAKRLFNDLPDRDTAAALLAESQEQEALIAGLHFAEAVAANLENRPPTFID